MTPEDFQEIVKLVCPHCRDGKEAKQRPDTKEWTHSTATSHTICWASGFRNSRFAPPQEG